MPKSNFGGSGKPKTRVDWAQKPFLLSILKNGKFSSKKDQNKYEVDMYLSFDELTCLECGGEYKNLSKHIGATHAMRPNDYKEKYNIQSSLGLCGAATRWRMGQSIRNWPDDVKVRVKATNSERLKIINKIGTKASVKKGYVFELEKHFFTCIECGKEFEKKNAATTREYKYCSLSCDAKHRWKNGLNIGKPKRIA